MLAVNRKVKEGALRPAVASQYYRPGNSGTGRPKVVCDVAFVNLSYDYAMLPKVRRNIRNV